MSIHAFNLGESNDDFCEFAATNWYYALELYDGTSHDWCDESSLSDSLFGAFAALEAHAERLRRFFAGVQGRLVTRFIAAVDDLWNQLQRAWLNEHHRRHLEVLAEQLRRCEPNDESAIRESLFRCPPWTTLPWQALEDTGLDLVRHLPDFPKCCFNVGSLLAAATRRSQRTHMPLLVDVDAQSPEVPETWERFVMGYVNPPLQDLLRKLCGFVPSLDVVESEVSIAAYRHANPNAVPFSHWAFERLESVFRQTRATLSAAEVHAMQGGDEQVWPSDDGWHVARGEAAFRGIRFAISGYPRALLEALVKARRRKTRDELVEEVWQATRSASAFHTTMSNLRQTLRGAFRLSADIDPIPQKDGGWKLAGDVILQESPILRGEDKTPSE